jgi:hypothetical protein
MIQGECHLGGKGNSVAPHPDNFYPDNSMHPNGDHLIIKSEHRECEVKETSLSMEPMV